MRYSDKIGQQIRSVREAKGYSQEYMAEMLGTCQSAYANLESGKSNMTIDRLLQITEILGMDVHQLFDQFSRRMLSPPQHQRTAPAVHSTTHPDVLQAYDQLIYELRTEIDFLRGLIRHQPPER